MTKHNKLEYFSKQNESPSEENYVRKREKQFPHNRKLPS